MILPRDNPSPDVGPMPASLSPWRISSQRYLEMIQEGAIGPEDRVELINGMMIDMSPAGSQHDDVIDRLNEQLFPIRNGYRVRVQSTLFVGEGQVYDPDVMLLKPRPQSDSYKDRHPDPNDVALLIEVAGSSLAKDRDVKLPIYAAAGISEYWLIDLESETVQINRQPKGNDYESKHIAGINESLTAECLPNEAIAVSDLFD